MKTLENKFWLKLADKDSFISKVKNIANSYLVFIMLFIVLFSVVTVFSTFPAKFPTEKYSATNTN